MKKRREKSKREKGGCKVFCEMRRNLKIWHQNTKSVIYKNGLYDTVIHRKPDGTLIPAHGNHVRAHKPKTGLGAKSNILFEFVQVSY